MSNHKTIYREVKYMVGIQSLCPGLLELFPMVHVEGHQATRVDDDASWVAPISDEGEMRLAYGAVQAECDQLNAGLQERGLNRLREVT